MTLIPVKRRPADGGLCRWKLVCEWLAGPASQLLRDAAAAFPPRDDEERWTLQQANENMQ